MGEFIKIEIDAGKCVGTDDCGRCIPVCPVNIFLASGKIPVASEQNEDECTLCELCFEACPHDAVIIRKLYESQ